MSKMLVITYDDGENSAVVSWSEEFGWFMAGSASVLDSMKVEERESRTVPKTTAIMPTIPAAVGVLTNAAAEPDTVLLDGGSCFSCGCPKAAHDEGGCAPHGCRTYVP